VRRMKITDQELLAEMQQGRSKVQIAAKWGMSKYTIYERVARLRSRATAVAVLAPPEAHTLVSADLDAISVMQECVRRLNMLSDAYH